MNSINYHSTTNKIDSQLYDINKSFDRVNKEFNDLTKRRETLTEIRKIVSGHGATVSSLLKVEVSPTGLEDTFSKPMFINVLDPATGESSLNVKELCTTLCAIIDEEISDCDQKLVDMERSIGAIKSFMTDRGITP